MRHALIHGAFLEAEDGIKLINFPAPKIGLRGPPNPLKKSGVDPL